MTYPRGCPEAERRLAAKGAALRHDDGAGLAGQHRGHLAEPADRGHRADRLDEPAGASTFGPIEPAGSERARSSPGVARAIG